MSGICFIVWEELNQTCVLPISKREINDIITMMKRSESYQNLEVVNGSQTRLDEWLRAFPFNYMEVGNLIYRSDWMEHRCKYYIFPHTNPDDGHSCYEVSYTKILEALKNPEH